MSGVSEAYIYFRANVSHRWGLSRIPIFLKKLALVKLDEFSHFSHSDTEKGEPGDGTLNVSDPESDFETSVLSKFIKRSCFFFLC